MKGRPCGTCVCKFSTISTIRISHREKLEAKKTTEEHFPTDHVIQKGKPFSKQSFYRWEIRLQISSGGAALWQKPQRETTNKPLRGDNKKYLMILPKKFLIVKIKKVFWFKRDFELCQQLQILFLEGFLRMMLLLIHNVLNNIVSLGTGIRKSSVTFLPTNFPFTNPFSLIHLEEVASGI